ncbi:MAG: hypothetical protein ACRDTA_20680 [Pseudonocardiaceae bacterium]
MRDTLPGVASPEVARLERRLDEQDDTVRALSDTVLDIKETIDQHTDTLAEIQQSQIAMQRSQVEMRQSLTEHGVLLAEILRRLGNSTAG